MQVIGVDPGLGGAIAIVQGEELLQIDDLPVESIGGHGTVKRRIAAAQLAAMLRGYRSKFPGEHWLVVVERVAAMPKQGVSSVFSLGDTSGCLRGVLQTLGFQTELVTPQAWKKALKVPADKDVARTIASARWPDMAHHWALKKSHNRAEAALLARYGWDVFA
jgi:crossover junction endodeoxyribonuclease RuvC